MAGEKPRIWKHDGWWYCQRPSPGGVATHRIARERTWTGALRWLAREWDTERAGWKVMC